MRYKLYEVGGAVRDQLLDIKSKDIDYSVVLDTTEHIDQAFSNFEQQLIKEGYEVFLPTPEVFTIKAKFPTDHKYSGVADFVLARKEEYYIKGTRRPVCSLGTLEDDLRRRDFTVNAIAKDEDGKLIDLFGGLRDLNYKSLDTPGDPNESFRDDPLRIIRGMRFCITKGFNFCRDVRWAIHEYGISGLEVVSTERIREELTKCFMHDTITTLRFMNHMEKVLDFPIMSYCFDNGLGDEGRSIRLLPTLKS